MNSSWKPIPDDFQLSHLTVDVWSFSLDLTDDEIKSLFALLNEEEQQRAERLKVSSKNQQFVISRARLRQTLSPFLACSAKEVCFEYLEHGKPQIACDQNRSGLAFNLSHSANQTLIAVTLAGEVGIDIEVIEKRTDITKLAGRFFSEKEQQALTDITDDRRRQAFFSCWSRKEAFIKAVGDGLSYGLGNFTVSVEPEPGPVELSLPDTADVSDMWSVWDIPVEAAFKAAVAVSRPDVELRCWKTT